MINQINSGTQYPGASIRAKSGQNNVSLSFIHTNDLHGYTASRKKPVEDGIVGGMARVAGEIESLRARNPECTVVVDGGDIFDGGFYSKYTSGEAVSRPFAQIGYDAVTLGNHDVSWGAAKVAEIAKESNTDFLAANLLDASPGGQLGFLKPYKVVERGGVKIGILGLTTPMTALSSPQKGIMEVESPVETAAHYIRKMKKDDGVDMVVVLSHLGYDEDVNLAEKVNDIDVIVGAHSHTVMKDAEEVNGTVIVQAGSEGRYVGDLEISFNPEDKKIVSYKENLVPINGEIKPDEKTEAVLAPYIEKFKPLKDKVLGRTDEALVQSNEKRTNLHRFFIDAQKMDSDLSVASAFSVRRGIDKGDVTFGKLFQMYPFDNELLQVKVKGENVVKFLEGGLSYVDDTHDTATLVSGLTYRFNPALEEGHRITSLTLDGKKISVDEFRKKNLTVSMDNYTHGKSCFRDGEIVKKYGKVFDILQHAMETGSPARAMTSAEFKRVDTVPQGASVAENKVGTLAEPLSYKEGQSSEAVSFFGNAIQGQADFSLFFNKSVRDGLPEGTIERSTLKKMYPFENRLYNVKTTGARILSLLEGSIAGAPGGHTSLTASGLSYTFDSTQPEGQKIRSIKVNNKSYDRAAFMHQNFKVAVDNFLYKVKLNGEEIEQERGSVFNALSGYLKSGSPLSDIKNEEASVDISESSKNTDAGWERKREMLAEGKGKIKSDEVPYYSLSKVTEEVDSTAAFATQKKMMESAQTGVGVTMYTLTHRDKINELVAKAGEGVPVRVAIDPHIHTTPDKLVERKEMEEKLLAGGVKLVEDPGDHIFCNHSKTLAVDGKESYVAKINWADYSEGYHDYGVHIEGGRAVSDVENYQNRLFHRSGFKTIKSGAAAQDVKNGTPIKVLVTDPDSASRVTPFGSMIKNLDEVEHMVRGQYFSLTSRPLVSHIIEMKKNDQGKVIRIVLNEGIFLESPLSQKYARELLDAGVEVKLYKDSNGKFDTLHAATTIYDRDEAVVGSANTTFGGLFSNREVDVDIAGEGKVEVLDRQFDYDWEHNTRDITTADLSLAESKEKAKPYYDTPISNIAAVMGIPESTLQKAQRQIYDRLGRDSYKTGNELEIKLIIQKLASMSYKDEAEFQKSLKRYLDLLTVEVADRADKGKTESKKESSLVRDAREALGDYIIMHNIAVNEKDASMDSLTGAFIKTFESMGDVKGLVDDTEEVRSIFADRCGIV